MVEAWLQQLDKVSDKGEPTWSILVAALQKIGHNGIAAKIKKERGSGGIHSLLCNILIMNECQGECSAAKNSNFIQT